MRILTIVSLLLAPGVFGQTRGAVFEDPEVYRDIPLAVAPMRGELPERVDLSGSFPRPGDQGDQGSCVGWATAYALKGYLEKKEREWPGRVSNELFSPAFIYNQIKLDGGGAYITSALDLLMQQGVATLASFPYDAGNDDKKPSDAVRREARQFAIASWRRVNPKEIGEVKSHLASGFPILIGMYVGNDFMKHRGSGVFSHGQRSNSEGGHAMCVVGYDDGKEAVKLINSWGTRWGDGGYAWVSYATFQKKVSQAFVVQDIVVYHPDEPEKDLDPEPSEESPWVFGYSGARKIAEAEMRVRSERELWRARNEIYARHGYAFQSAKGKRYAASLGRHYKNQGKSAAQVEAGFNAVEHYNVALILSYEKGRARPNKPEDKAGWIFADSSVRRLNQYELESLSNGELWRARNEIFARNGYVFQSEKGKALAKFMGPLYEPKSSDMEQVFAAMNAVERENVLLIRRYERR
ncbi:YARHG domain-containing protein [Rubritalea tangerina]|uniref:YARHG domain-containing protein n=2 Tax=Rubritalea tangerina TaxID=430798 RepID=A0ABW4ZFC2_9BACT